MSKRDLFTTGFKAEDFDLDADDLMRSNASQHIYGLVAAQANEILREALAEAQTVYGYIGTEGSNWSSYPPGTFIQENHTHTAKLVSIKKIGET